MNQSRLHPPTIKKPAGIARQRASFKKKGNSKMTPTEHCQRHLLLHEMLDELVADFIDQTGKMPSIATLTDLMHWSYEQTISPTDKHDRDSQAQARSSP